MAKLSRLSSYVPLWFVDWLAQCGGAAMFRFDVLGTFRLSEAAPLDYYRAAGEPSCVEALRARWEHVMRFDQPLMWCDNARLSELPMLKGPPSDLAPLSIFRGFALHVGDPYAQQAAFVWKGRTYSREQLREHPSVSFFRVSRDWCLDRPWGATPFWEQGQASAVPDPTAAPSVPVAAAPDVASLVGLAPGDRVLMPKGARTEHIFLNTNGPPEASTPVRRFLDVPLGKDVAQDHLGRPYDTAHPPPPLTDQALVIARAMARALGHEESLRAGIVGGRLDLPAPMRLTLLQLHHHLWALDCALAWGTGFWEAWPRQMDHARSIKSERALAPLEALTVIGTSLRDAQNCVSALTLPEPERRILGLSFETVKALHAQAVAIVRFGA